MLAAAVDPVTAEPRALAYAGRCSYVVGPGAMPFCERPTLPASAYCAWHHALCAVDPASPDFAALAANQAHAGDRAPLPPPELAWLCALAPPEPFDESDNERLTGLDLPPMGTTHDE